MLKTILLQGLPAGGQVQTFIMIGAMVLIFYFFMIRPQQRKQKETKKFIAEVKKGDHIVTLGGIHGKVVSVEDNTIMLDIDRGNKLVVEKSSISLDTSKRLQNK